MKFIHAADIHLDSPLSGLARYEGAPVEHVQNATRRAFINLVNFACQEKVDFVLLAGDLYDVDWKDYNTGLFFNQQMSQLREANIPVFSVRGNHDAGNSMTKQLRLPENVREFSTQRPETIKLEPLDVAIHGQSFADKMVTTDLSAQYPSALPNYFNIGLLHTGLTGREGHAHYAPCTLPSLLTHGYDYWALGHVHKREILHEHPFIVFPGNLQGRHVREPGAKGCTLVQITESKVSLTHTPLDVVRWEICPIDAAEITCAEDIVDKTQTTVAQLLQNANERPLALRFVITGATPAHAELHENSLRWTNEIRTAVTDVGAGKVWVEKITLRTHPVHSVQTQTIGALEELVHILRALPDDYERLRALGAEFRPLKQVLPLEMLLDEKGLDPEHPDTLRYFLGRVEKLLLARLLKNS